MRPIELENIRKVIPIGFLGKPKVLVEDVSLSLTEGSIHGFIGANGAGKSTSMRVMIGVSPATSGKARLFGGSPTKPEHRQLLGYAPDMPALPRALTGAEFLELHATLRGVSRDDVNRVLKVVDLTSARGGLIRGYSKGMQQRLSLAAAILGRPRLLILDEPMSGLDPWGRELVRQIIRMANDDGASIIFSSHVITDVEALCDTVTLIDKGRTKVTGNIDHLIGPARGFRIGVAGGHPEQVAIGDCVRRGQHTVVEINMQMPLETAIAKLRAAECAIVSVETVRETLEQRLLGEVTAANVEKP